MGLISDRVSLPAFHVLVSLSFPKMTSLSAIKMSTFVNFYVRNLFEVLVNQ